MSPRLERPPVSASFARSAPEGGSDKLGDIDPGPAVILTDDHGRCRSARSGVYQDHGRRELPSHRRGHWFDTSIAHHKKYPS
jgi:hypothetical protein